MEKDEWLSKADVEKEYKLKDTTQAHLRHARKIQYTKAGKEVIYKRRWIEEYLERNTREAAV